MNDTTDEHDIVPASPTGRIDSPVTCDSCGRSLFIGDNGGWEHVPRRKPQGEPSDVQVLTAIQTFYNAPGIEDWVDETKDDMRAALRAAWAVR